MSLHTQLEYLRRQNRRKFNTPTGDTDEVVRGDGSLGSLPGLLAYECGEDLSSHRPVALIDNKLYYMDNTNMAHMYAFVGFTKTSGLTGDIIEVEDEKISLTGWTHTPNQTYLAGAGGALATTVTTAGAFTKVIAFAQDAETLLIYKHYTAIIKS